MKRFTLYRPFVPETHTADQKAPADQPQLEGIIFSDGTCVLRWCTTPSTSVWSSFEDMAKIHGHPEYGTYFVWHDGAPASDSDGSGEADETHSGSAVGDSAGRQASHNPTPETPNAD
jgi:hypothetical protein